MALSVLPHGLKFAVAAVILAAFLVSKSDASGLNLESVGGRKQMKMAVGSKPPGCVDKCMSCRPCKATLVPVHPSYRNGIEESPHGEEDEEDIYYPVSWKCICGDQLYQP